MFTAKDIERVFQAPWWESVKNEVIRTITIRISTREPLDRPHGSLLGQAFLDILNDVEGRVEAKEYVHYLSTRSWAELVTDASPNLSERALEALRHPQGEKWFQEFRRFVLRAWGRSIGEEEVDVRIFHRELFDIIVQEFKRHVALGDPLFLANTVMEWLRDEHDGERRKITSMAIAFIMPRKLWEVLGAASKEYDLDLSSIDTEEASVFFEQLKYMIEGAMGDYWHRFLPEEGQEPQGGEQ